MNRNEFEGHLEKIFGGVDKIRISPKGTLPGLDELFAHILKRGEEPAQNPSSPEGEQEKFVRLEIKRFDGKRTENGSYMVHYIAELPGVKENDITLKISARDGVEILAKRKLPWEKEVVFKGVHSKVEEDFDLDKASAKFEDGLLNVIVPVINPEAKTIKINS